LTTIIIALALARIMAGETPGCPVEAKVAIGHVYHNRITAGVDGGWFGDAEPTALDTQVALTWHAWPDPTDGALYAIGPGDAAKMPWLKTRTGRWDCGGTWIETWQ
jgi:hypothetical protein